ncbi:MAG: cyclodeaminase/cyclohydrolase family protein [Phycisphaerae bacterium]
MPNNDDLLALPVGQFIDAIAAKTPTPGGGSVAGVVGAMAVALAEMALNFTQGKKKYAKHEEFHAHLAARLRKMRGMFQDLVADDISAYGLYQETTRREDGPEKDTAMQLALAAAIDVPREAAKLSLALLEDLQAFADKCSPYLISDLAAAAALAAATARLSDYNVRVNVPQVADAAGADEVRRSSADDLAKAGQLLTSIEQSIGKHLQ